MIAIELLPKKTYNCEPFGLMFMIDGDSKMWTCSYYSHFSKKSDDRFPTIKGFTIEDAALNMFEYINKNFPDLIVS